MNNNEKNNERLLLAAVFLFWFSNYTYPSFLTTYVTNTLGAAKVLAGMIVGAAVVFIWKFAIAPAFGGIFAIYELLPAFICASIAIIVVSLLTAPPDKEIVEEFESIGK